MKTNQLGIDLPGGLVPKEDFTLFEYIITDRGSKYSVCGGLVKGREDIKKILKKLKSKKDYAKATHHSWAARITNNQSLWETKADDGETGAGEVILRIMRREDLRDSVVIVTRWFGGIQLHADRFKHVGDATKYFILKVRTKSGL